MSVTRWSWRIPALAVAALVAGCATPAPSSAPFPDASVPPPAVAPAQLPSSPPEPSASAEGAVVVDGWAFPTPYPLPTGATSLVLDVLPVPEHVNIPDDAVIDGCRLKAIGITVEYDPSATPPLTFNGGKRGPLWPFGVSARFWKGRAEIVLPDGSVVARGGDHVTLPGGLYGDTDRDLVCLPGTSPSRP